jgi:hypothetical protein
VHDAEPARGDASATHTVLLCRPYVRLQTYEISEDKKMLEYKFRTEKRGKCSGQHCTRPGHLGTYMYGAVHSVL